MKYGQCCLMLTTAYTYIIANEMLAQLTLSGTLSLQVVVVKGIWRLLMINRYIIDDNVRKQFYPQ